MQPPPRRAAASRLAPLVTLALAALAGCAPRPARPPLPHPAGGRWNVLLVTIDTCRADVLQALGAEREIAPTLERLVDEGVLWTRSETTVPLTLPAHCTLLTGLYPGTHGVRHNAQYALSPSHVTLATVLAGAGYETAAFVAAYPLSPEYGTDQGFATYDADLDRSRGVESERSAAAVNARAVPWLERPRSAPFLAWVHYFEPHDPYTPPEPHRSRHPDSPYHGEVAAADAALAEVLRALERGGHAASTLVVVAGDHGEGLGEHDEPFHGLLLYETTTHVPVVFWGGPLARVRHEVAFPTSLADVLPTVLGLLGAPAPAGVQGFDLSEQVRGGTATPDRPGVISETFYGHLEFGWSPLRALRRERHRFIEAPVAELYDLREDPGERRSLAAKQPELVAAMRADLLAQEAASRSAEAGAATKPLGPEELEALQSLGYVASGGGVDVGAPVVSGPDPKAMMGLYARYNEARGRLDGGDPAGALALLDEIVPKDPANLQFRGKRAKALAFLGRAAEAEAEWRGMIARDPRHFHAYWDLAILLELVGQTRRAVDVLRDLQRVDPTYVGLRERIAQLLGTLGDVPAAVDALAPAGVDQPPAAALLSLGGALALRAGDARRAAELLRRAAAATPGAPVPPLLVAAEADARGDTREALAHLERLTTEHPEDPGPWGQLCSAALRAGRADTALYACSRLVELPSHAPSDEADVVQALLMAGREQEARVRTEQALGANPGWWWMHRAWAAHAAARGDRELARAAIEAWLASDPASEAARQRLSALR